MPNRSFSCDYDFDGIYLLDEWEATGTAELEDDLCDGFFVKQIVLSNGTRLVEKGNGPLGFPNAVRDGIATIIIDEIIKSDHAADFFHRAKEEASQPDPDRYYDERRNALIHAA